VVVIHFAGMVWVTANQYNTLSHEVHFYPDGSAVFQSSGASCSNIITFQLSDWIKSWKWLFKRKI